MVLMSERGGQLGVLGGGVRPRHGAVLRPVRALHWPVTVTKIRNIV